MNSEPTKEVRQWNGIPLNITTKIGEPRFSFSPPMTCDYGCIRGSWGAGLDGKALDVYVVSDAPTVFKVVQITPAGAIDEYKYVLGAQDFDHAVETFLKHVPKQLFGAASQYSIAQLQNDIAQQSKVKKDANELTEFVQQLESLIESDDAYGSNVYVLSLEVASDGDITGKFEDAWNRRVFSYSVQKDRIGYKPALNLDRSDSATAAKRFDLFSSGYTSLGIRQDAAKSGKKPRCTAISYGCGRACIQLKNTCWINSSGQKVKKAGGAVASISQGRIDKLRTLARYLAANGNNKWSKYGSAELLAAKASNLEAKRVAAKIKTPTAATTVTTAPTTATLPSTGTKSGKITAQQMAEQIAAAKALEPDTGKKLPNSSKLLPKIIRTKQIDAPTEKFDEKDLRAAAESFLELGGFVEPPVVKRTGTELNQRYEVISGQFQVAVGIVARAIDPIRGEVMNAIVIEEENEAAISKQMKAQKNANAAQNTSTATKSQGKSQRIESYDDFKKTAIDTYNRLNKGYNYTGLVPIWHLRRELGEQVSRENFKDLIMQMQTDRLFYLQSGEARGATKEQKANSISDDVRGLLFYVSKPSS